MKKIKINAVLPIAIILVTVICMLFFTSSIASCSNYFDEDANQMALSRISNVGDLVCQDSYTYLKRTGNYASAFSGIDPTQESGYQLLEKTADKYGNQSGVISLSVWDKEGVITSSGPYVVDTNDAVTAALVKANKEDSSSVYYEKSIGKYCVNAYSPVSSNSAIKGVLVCFTASDVLLTDSVEKSIQKDAVFSAIITDDGKYISKYKTKNFQVDNNNNFFDYAQNMSKSKLSTEGLKKAISDKAAGAITTEFFGEEYEVAFSALTGFDGKCKVVAFYSKSTLLNSEYRLYKTLWGSIIGVMVLCILLLAIYLVTHYTKKFSGGVVADKDPILNCYTYAKFEQVAKDILISNRLARYALVYLDINNFRFALEHFDNSVGEEAKIYISQILNNITNQNETYGHVIDDCFVALLRCNDNEDLTMRVNIINGLTNNFEPFKKSNYSIKFTIGVYIIDPKEEINIKRMLDHAVVAQLTHKRLPTEPYVVYDDTINSDYLVEVEIESRMDSALKNGEFHLFFQPKYDIRKNSISGAEVLVRWYDRERNGYVPPGKFVPLFESNGFISQLDRYVFEKSCEFLSQSLGQGLRVSPLSINVSRVTAIQEDFLDFYIRTKRKYNIIDNFLTIEFTESFAFDNYEVLKRLVTTLQSNGFKCSIDDFGSGYSSYNVLKELPMDELKLDMSLLKKSENSERDKILLEMITNLGHAFGMYVTQEGIETIEDLEMLKSINCDVIQGYFYSKPLMTSDFTDFINSPTDMKTIIARKDERLSRQPKYLDFK